MYNFNRYVFGRRLLEAIKKKGMTQRKFSIYAGISQSTLEKYCTGHNMPSAEILALLANKLEVDINWLCNKEGVELNEKTNKRQVLSEYSIGLK